LIRPEQIPLQSK